MSKTFSVVSHSLPKIDALSLIQGKPAYTDDLAPADALVVKLLHQPHAFARSSHHKSQALAARMACVLDWRIYLNSPEPARDTPSPVPTTGLSLTVTCASWETKWLWSPLSPRLSPSRPSRS